MKSLIVFGFAKVLIQLLHLLSSTKRNKKNGGVPEMCLRKNYVTNQRNLQ